MTAAERLADALKVSGKVKGFVKPIYKDDGSLDHYARHMIEVVADDVLELATAITDETDKIAAAQRKGCARHAPGTRVILLADDVYHLIEAAPK